MDYGKILQKALGTSQPPLGTPFQDEVWKMRQSLEEMTQVLSEQIARDCRRVSGPSFSMMDDPWDAIEVEVLDVR